MALLDQSQSWQYIRDNPDLLQQFEQDAKSNPNLSTQEWANNHYLLHGQSEGRQIPNSVSTEQVLGWPTYSNATAQGMGMLSTAIDPAEQARRQTQADDAMYQGQYADYLQAQNAATAYRDQLGNGLYDAADADVWQAARLNTPIVIRNGQAVDVKDYLNQKYGTYDWITFLKNNNVANLPDNPNQQASVYRDYMKTLQGFSPTQTPGLFSTPVATAAPTPAPVPGTSSFQPAASGSGLLNGSNGSSGNAANTAYGMMMYDPQRARSFTTGPAPTVQDSSAWQAQYPSMFR